MALFSIDGLSFTYPEQTDPALDGIRLDIDEGSFFVLCGHSGSGKSTLLRHLKPALTPHGTRSGAVLFHGEPVDALAPADAAGKIGFVLQSPDEQIATDTVLHELAFGLESIGCAPAVIRRRVAEIAAFFGIDGWLSQPISTLSGGQKQLLNLAAVMTLRPEVLILDEPTAQLDPIAATGFIDALNRLHRELGTTVILSEHRLEEALTYADRAAVMEKGKLLCTGTAREIGEYLKGQQHTMFAAMPCAMRVWSTVETDLPCPVSVHDGRAFLAEYTREHPALPLVPEPTAPAGGAEMLRAAEVSFRYGRDLPDVIHGLDLTVCGGEIFCILGGNGAGKSTLLKLFSGICRPQRGTLTATGRVMLLPQEPQTVFIKKTVYDDLYDRAIRENIPADLRRAEIDRVAALCHIEKRLDRHPFDLSGGELQCAALSKLLLCSPDVLLLDEPTKGMDAPMKGWLAELLQSLKAGGTAIVIVSHDVEFCALCADRCGMFFDGAVTSVAPARAFFSDNRYYTTAANRMAREIAPLAVTVEDVTALIGGKAPAAAPKPPAETVLPAYPKPPTRTEQPLPLWRRIAAAISGAAAVGLFVYCTKSKILTGLVDATGATTLGLQQLAIYGVLFLLFLLTAVFIGRRSRPSVTVQTPRDRRRLSRRTVFAAGLILLLIPVTLFCAVWYLNRQQYGITAAVVLAECMLPFFLIFEGRKPRARELALIAALCALAIAGRAAFLMFPQCKPVLAMTVIAGVALGGETGFLVGAVTMLLSNMLFSQGPWTPWQMFAMGIIGFLAGVLYRKGFLLRSRVSLCIFGILSTFLFFGVINNAATAIVWSPQTVNLNMILGYCLTGFPADAVHAAATALFLWFGAEPMLTVLDRIKTKYGLVE